MLRRSFGVLCAKSSAVTGSASALGDTFSLQQSAASGGLQDYFPITSEVTPNPDCVQFRCNQEDFLPDPDVTCDINSVRRANLHPLAYALFEDYKDDIRAAFMSQKYLTVTKWEDKSWEAGGLQESIENFLGTFLHLNGPLPPDPLGAVVKDEDTKILPTDSEVLQCIKELVKEQVKPMVQRDGGDVKLISFDPDSGIVKFGMLGACASCPSSENTLKNGIERLLVHWLPEVKSVQEEKDRTLFASDEAPFFVKQEAEVTKILQDFDDERQKEYQQRIRKRTPSRASFEELNEPGFDDDDEDEDEERQDVIPLSARDIPLTNNSSSSSRNRKSTAEESDGGGSPSKSVSAAEEKVKKGFTLDDVQVVTSSKP